MTPLRLAVLSIVVGAFPFLIAAAAKAIANHYGCTLNEGDATKCIVMGRDISSLLYNMYMFAWLGMFTLGLGVMGVVGSGIWALVRARQ